MSTMRKAVLKLVQSDAGAPKRTPKPEEPGTDIFVSPMMFWFEEPRASRYAKVFTFRPLDRPPIVYRKLNYSYFAWLSRQMYRLLSMALDEKIPWEEYQEMEARWEALEEVLKQRVGEVKLAEILKTFNPEDFDPAEVRI